MGAYVTENMHLNVILGGVNLRRKLLIVMCIVLLIGLTGCGKKKEEVTVKYWNSKPEVADVWETIAADYYSETGVRVEIINPPTNASNQTLLTAMAKKNPPTIFKVGGQANMSVWEPYCRDLSDTELYSWVLDKSMVLTKSDKTGAMAIPYVVEGYGIIYNNAIMNEYFALSSKSTAYSSMSEINSFNKLKEVADDMQQHKDELGIKGVFASTSFASGEEWRWQTHLFNMPLYGEYKKKGVADLDSIDFMYGDCYKNIFDLYTEDSTCDKSEIGTKTVNDSMAEFALGECAMVQNGNWAWSQISSTEGNVVKEADCKYMPIYCGLEGEESQGLCVGTENYVAVNTLASEEAQEAAIAFLEWLYGSDKGKAYVTNDLQFITIFNTFASNEAPSNPLAVEVSAYLNDASKPSVTWDFLTIPSQEYKDGIANQLYDYTQGKSDWSTVTDYAVEQWKLQKTGE